MVYNLAATQCTVSSLAEGDADADTEVEWTISGRGSDIRYLYSLSILKNILVTTYILQFL